MNEIPKISITQDFDHDEEMDSECTGNIAEAHTDFEDLDSDGTNGQFPPSQLLEARKKVKSKEIDECATDIEDCQDSGSDDASDLVKISDDHLSLNAFLDQGFTEEISTCSGNDKIKHSRRGKRASLFVPVEDDGAVTDCEDLNTSDDDLIFKEFPNDPKYDNFLIGNDDFSSVSVENSAYVQEKKEPIASSRNGYSSDSENDSPTVNWDELSETENIAALSDPGDQPIFNHIKYSASAWDAEEIILVTSDNEGACSRTETIPEICVEFRSNCPRKLHSRIRHTQNNKNRISLNVQQNTDEAVTDIENLDSSDDEGMNLLDESKKNLTIPLAYVISSDRPLTDVEEFDVDDDCIPTISNDIKLPSPVREIIVTREDQHGDPVAKVMPLVISANGSYLGIQEDYVDKG